MKERTVYPYEASCDLRCDGCGAIVKRGELCEATCMETETGTLLAPHEINTCLACDPPRTQ